MSMQFVLTRAAKVGFWNVMRVLVQLVSMKVENVFLGEIDLDEVTGEGVDFF